MSYLRERWRLFLGLAVLGVVLWAAGIFGYAAWFSGRSAVWTERFQRVQIGMSRAEVDGVFDGPGKEGLMNGTAGPWFVTWETGGLVYTVGFDEEGRVREKSEPLRAWTMVGHMLCHLPF